MNIFFSGIGGVGIGPLAEIAHDAGHTVAGSDLTETLITEQLKARGVSVTIGQDGTELAARHAEHPIDWFVYTSALPQDHPELLMAASLGIKTGKRDEFLATFLKEHDLKLIAIAGTHGKTSTTGMAVWALKQLNIPVSYSVGTTLTFGPSGVYTQGSKYFIYECDEFDRNFLHFNPDVSVITSIDYDHPDTYPTEAAYKEAFLQYISQSQDTIMWQTDWDYLSEAPPLSSILALSPDEVFSMQLPGAHTRRNGTLVVKLLESLGFADQATARQILETFPGTDRRFEKIGVNLYTDYGHHPKEIAATLQLAKELAGHVTLVYQPHQNIRQHEIRQEYTDELFEDADTVYWLPTYLTRERDGLAVLTPEDLTYNLKNTVVNNASLDVALEEELSALRAKGSLVLCMGAGTIDAWARAYAGKNLTLR